jgi:two-component system CheB/CheR fusion protein
MMRLSEVIRLGHASPEIVKKLSTAQLFDTVREEFTDVLFNMNATLTVDFSHLPEIVYIESWLKTIFSNVLSNAIHYAHPQRRLHVIVVGHKEGDKAVLYFTDNGLGIDLETVGEKLFDPFTRFSSNNSGSGMGLYLIKSITERNGGTIKVESTPGEGTTFRLTLQPYKLVKR